MAIEALAYISGHFTANFKGTDIGSTREGFRLIPTHHTQLVQDDAFGDAPANAIHQGTSLIVELDYVNYSAIYSALHAFETTEGDGVTNVGKLLATNNGTAGLGGTLLLTANPGTPADNSANSGSYTFWEAIVCDDLDVLLASKLKQGRCHFRVFPSAANGYALYQAA